MKAYVPLNKPSRDLLLDLINTTNSISPPLTFSQVFFDAPSPISGNLINVFKSNTKVVVKDLGSVGYDNSRLVYYNRIEIGALFTKTVVTVPVDFNNVAEAIAALNSTYDLKLSVDEIGYMESPSINRVDITIGDSYVYVPGSKLSIVADTETTRLEEMAHRVWFYANYTLPADVAI